MQFFGGLPMLVAGREVRAPFGVADAEGLLPVEDNPEALTVTLLDEAGEEVVAPIEVARHAEGLPRAYFPLRFTVDEPGIYTGRTEVAGEVLEMAIQIDAAGDVQRDPARRGAAGHGHAHRRPMPRASTRSAPTTRSARSTTSRWRRRWATTGPWRCWSPRRSSARSRSAAPCSTSCWGSPPTTPTIRFLHAEVYAHPHEETDTKAPVVDELGLTFEPCLVLVGADGKVVDRLDTIFDAAEVSASLADLS